MAGLLALIAHALILGLLILLLHRLTPRVGFTPLLVVMGGLMMMLQSQLGLFFELTPGITFFFSQVSLVPPILAAILVIYVANGSRAARLVLLSILGISLLIGVLAQTYRWTLGLPGAQTITPFTIGAAMSYITFSPRVVFGSVVAFLADMLVITIVYQGLKNLRIGETWIIGSALLAALWTDFVVFSLFVDLGKPDFVAGIPGGLLTKTLAALILWLPVALYLTQIAPRMPDFVGGENRPLLDIFLNRERSLEKALNAAENARLQVVSEKEREQVYIQQIVNHIDEAMWLADAGQKVVLFVNPAYERLWGRPASSFLGNAAGFEESLHPEDRDRVIRGYPQHKRGDYIAEYRIVRPDGSVRWVRDRVFPIHDLQGELYRFAGFTTDITDEKRAEEQRLQLAVEQEKVRLLREFVAEVTHDLKTPLSSIHLKIYQALRTDDAARRAQALNEVSDQAERMGSMINDMLTLSRLETLTDITLYQTNLNDVIREVNHARIDLAHKREVTLLEVLSQLPIPVLADRDDLGRAIGNLVDNAIHYTPAGGRIEVKSEALERHAVVIIRDTGIGIAENDLPNIFERFFRADNGRAADPGGTGLGLAIVKRVVQAHHGSIDVTSEVGIGTTFRITLPILRNGNGIHSGDHSSGSISN